MGTILKLLYILRLKKKCIGEVAFLLFGEVFFWLLWLDTSFL